MVFDSGGIPTRLVNNKPNFNSLVYIMFIIFYFFLNLFFYIMFMIHINILCENHWQQYCTVGMLDISPIAF